MVCQEIVNIGINTKKKINKLKIDKLKDLEYYNQILHMLEMQDLLQLE